MPALASLEDLQKLNGEIQKVREQYPDACQRITELLRKNRKTGYRNFCKLFTGERTPETLKKAKK